jgi:dihydrofolate reductase
MMVFNQRRTNMRKVIVSEYVSVDGVMEDPGGAEGFEHGGWTNPYWNDDIAKFKSDENFASDALLLGRVTYQAFAAAWPESADEGADRMNSLPKFVATRILEHLEWNATPLKGDVVEEVARLKQQPGQDLLIYGSGELVHTLMQHNLIDEYRLLVYPVVLGSGKRLFRDGSATTLKLVETKPFSSGVVALIYQPAQHGV